MATYIVEFIAGSFDGYEQPISIPPSQLAPRTAIPVSQDMLCLIDGRRPSGSAPVTSIAVYQRAVSDGVIRYCFVEARPPTRQYVAG